MKAQHGAYPLDETIITNLFILGDDLKLHFDVCFNSGKLMLRYPKFMCVKI